MKSCVVYYFSGTGNTERVADMIKEEFLKQQCSIDLIKIEDILKGKVKMSVEKYDLVGIGCPVIGYGIPNIVQRFLSLFPKGNDKKVFIFRTAGGVAPINYNASKALIRKLTKKDYDIFHERVFSISSNWVFKYDDAVIRQLYQATKKKVSIMCNEVLNGQKRVLKTSLRLKVLMETVSAISSVLLRLAGKDMTINKSCSHCGLCIKNCPTNNIYEKRGKIQFKFSCTNCMRCVYSCPKNAIHFRILNFFAVPGGYNIMKILNQPYKVDESSDSSKPQFFNEYINNDKL
jgi:ferredoxin